MATDSAFLAEISAFLATSELQVAGPHAKRDNSDQAAFSGDVDTPSTSPMRSPVRIEFSSTAPALDVVSKRTKSYGNETKTTKRKIKETIRKQRYQRRLRHERETLRRMDMELSRQLIKLQQDAEKQQQGTIAKLVLAKSIWRDLAIQQREHRNRAEKEKKKLVSAVSIQASYLATLRGLLPKDQCDVDPIKQEIRLAITSSLQLNTLANGALYDDHFQQVVVAFGQVDEVFRELVKANGITTSICRNEINNDIKYFQHFNKFTQPFSFTQTQHTMWTLAKLHHRQQDREECDDLGDPEDTVVIRFRLGRTLATGTSVSVMQRYIFRRFVGKTRTVFTWKTYSEGEDIFAGMLLEETGWACLQPSTDGDSTVVEVCVRQSPMRFGGSSPSRAGTQDFYDVMQRSVTEDAQAITSSLSKLLLEETLADINI
ncbi:hypothetical protein KRP22_014318 [Phytophthora ramorum]|nr:hypothetical protein KRP22_9081 [Phytophthora ramorum]